MASRIIRNLRRIPSSTTFTNGVRYQSKVTDTTTTTAAASSSSLPASSAVRIPVTTSSEHNKKGNVGK